MVALNIDSDGDFRDELSRLNNAFGIGIIQLDPEHVDESEIILPAHSKEVIDWATVDRLSDENPEFKEVIESILSSMKIAQTHGKYDQPYNEDEYKQYLERQRIMKTK